MNRLRVLLISPLRGLDPPCGDITYTETLLAHPPVGVTYETHAAALEAGRLTEHASRRRVWREPVATATSKMINIARRRGWLFWEPFRFFSVAPGVYDLVHVHVFSPGFWRLDCPLVVSNGAPQTDLYLDRRGWPAARVRRMAAADRWLARRLGVNSFLSGLPQASRAMVYTDYYKELMTAQGVMPADRVDVVPIMHEPDRRPVQAATTPVRIGFVANDFNAKGGQILLEAFGSVRRRMPGAELWIVGSPRLVDPVLPAGVRWVGPVDRRVLLDELLPSFDVFAYPTPHDCFSYVVLEAMAAGCAIATSDYISMPEAVDYGRAGLISPVGNAAQLADNIVTLLDPATNARFRRAARDRFEQHFSCAVVSSKVFATYRAAIDDPVRQTN